MRQTVIFALTSLVCLSASTAFGGRIFGDITLNGKPLPAGAKLTIRRVPPTTVPGAKPENLPAVVDTTVTDDVGSYKLTVKEEGKCILTLEYGEHAPTLEVFSYKEATRYDLILEQSDDALVLRRK